MHTKGIFLFCIVLVSVTIISCASTMHERFQSNANYEEVYKACLLALDDTDFKLTKSNSKKGVIEAEERIILGARHIGGEFYEVREAHGSPIKINVKVKRAPTGTYVEVEVKSWNKTFCDERFKGYEKALKKQLPDVKVVRGE